MSNRRRGAIEVREPSNSERRPLLARSHFSHAMGDEPFFSCGPNAHAHLPVYTNILRIRRDVKSIVEDYLTFEQLRDLRLNISVVRPLVDKLYELDDISIVYCLLVNRHQFLQEQEHLTTRQNVNFTRATLCEVVATRILRRFGDDNPGSQGLLLLANILVAGFETFQNAPQEVRREASISSSWSQRRSLPALEIAILTESKHFLSSPHSVKIINAIYSGQVIYTPSTFMDLIPDRYKQKPISLYEPARAPLLDHYRLIVPRTRHILEIIQFATLLFLYLLFMVEREPDYLSPWELAFSIYAFGWVLDQFATMLEHGWNVYSQNLWSFLDVMFAIIYWIYLLLRIHGWRTDEDRHGQQALDVLAMGAPVLIPRLAFNTLSDNIVFLALRSMMADFMLLTLLAGWCFVGFLLSMFWLAAGRHEILAISKWMLWIWFGLDGSGIDNSSDFHWLLGPILMVTFAFLGNTLFLTILVAMLTNTFGTIVANATAEVQFRKAVQTLEGVKADAIFAYQPPFNIIALFLMVPMKFIVSPRWFHKIHVATVRFINLPILLILHVMERRLLWTDTELAEDPTEQLPKNTGRPWFWERWKISTHGDIEAVFKISPPVSVEGDIRVDDSLTHHAIRRQFVRQQSSVSSDPAKKNSVPSATPSRSPGHVTPTPTIKENGNEQIRPLGRRDSIGQFGFPEQAEMAHRMDLMEVSISRIEKMMSKLCGETVEEFDDDDDDNSNDGTAENTTGYDEDEASFEAEGEEAVREEEAGKMF